jgi:hypothetical protein
MMTKWDTIQADVADAYVYLDEEEAYNNVLENEEDVFNFAKAIEIDHLTDEQLDMISNMFETREAD